MKIKVNVSISGPGITAAAGDVVDIDDKLARQMIAAGYAETVRSAPKERAVRKARSEKAVG